MGRRARARRLAVATCAVAITTVTMAPAALASPPGTASEQRPAQSQEGSGADHAAEQRERRGAPGATTSADKRDERAGRARDARQEGPASKAQEPGGNAADGRGRGVEREPAPARAGGERVPRGPSEASPRGNDNAGDPNRGTVKVRSTGQEAATPRHEPKPGCEFWLHFHGFDADESRAFALYAWSPTGDGQQVYSGTVTLEQARGNGYSAIYPSGGGLTLEDLRTDAWPQGYEPHQQQGWHLRLEVDGPKHKMFWIDCDESIMESSGRDLEAGPRAGGTDGDPAADASATSAIGGAAPGDEDAVRALILGEGHTRSNSSGAGDAAVLATGGAASNADSPSEQDAEVLASAAGGGESRVLAMTGAHLGWLAAAGLLLASIGTRMVHRRRGQAEAV
jgi:hypothetical protein